MLRVTFAMVTKTKNRRMKIFSKNCSHFNLWYIKYWNNYTVNFQINVKRHWWANKKLKNVTMEAENYFKKKPQKIKMKHRRESTKTQVYKLRIILGQFVHAVLQLKWCCVGSQEENFEKVTQLGTSSSYMLIFLRYLREYYMPGGLEYELKLSKKNTISFLYCMYL